MTVAIEPALADPLSLPEQRAIVDRVIMECGGIPGAPMVVLGELQSQIGFGD